MRELEFVSAIHPIPGIEIKVLEAGREYKRAIGPERYKVDTITYCGDYFKLSTGDCIPVSNVSRFRFV